MAMDFVVATNSGTHVYRASGLEKPVLLSSLPAAQPNNPHCLCANGISGTVSVLLQSGSAAVWDVASARGDAGGVGAGGAGPGPVGGAGGSGGLGPPVEIPPQSGGPITRCYFSPRGTFLVAWEPLGKLMRVQHPSVVGQASPGGYPSDSSPGGGTTNGGKGGGGGGGSSSSTDRARPLQSALAKAENLSLWAIARRPAKGAAQFVVEVSRDGQQRLGVNVDHLDGRSGLLIRRVDPGLVDAHNHEAYATDQCGSLVLPGDRIVDVNSVGISAGAQAMAGEIQRAQKLRLTIRRGPAWAAAIPSARFFAPHISALRWPPVAWTADEAYAFRSVSNEVQVLDGWTLKQLRRLQIDNISQLSVSPGAGQYFPDSPSTIGLAVFSPASTSAAPAMIRVYTDVGKGAKPTLTKSFFSDSAWVTMRWDPCAGTDLLVLLHSSELTEADLEGRTLHGQGGNGLYLLRASRSDEPLVAISNSQDGPILDVQWCSVDTGDKRSLVVLQGPQPALVSVFSYRIGGGSSSLVRVNLGRFGVRNNLRWDTHGRSFCLWVQSLRGVGISCEGDTIDLFDMAPAGTVARRASASVVGRRDREQPVGPSVMTVHFSPDGQALLAAVEAHSGSELRFVRANDGSALYRLKFEEIFAAMWRPCQPGEFVAPHFDPPAPQARLGSLTGSGTLEVELKDREVIRRRVKALKGTEAEEDSQDGCDDRLVWEVHSAWGMHLLEGRVGDNCRELARRFCRDNHLDMALATPLAERMEQRLRDRACAPGGLAPGAGGGSADADEGTSAAAPAPPKRRGPQPKVIDFGDKEAVRRRVRALQKKLREIEKLKMNPEGCKDELQREKVASEGEVRAACASLERELDLLERIPKMVFDVETEHGARYLEFREGDDCYELAKQFCREHGLDKDLVRPLAEHMQEKLREQDLISEA